MTSMSTDPLDFKPRQVRKHILWVRVTEDERQAIAVNAADAGSTMVEFIRTAIREHILALRPALDPRKKRKR